MHSIAMSSPPDFFNDLRLYRQSNPILPFPALDHDATITTKKDAASKCRDFGSSVSFGLLQSDDVTTLCSTGSQQGVDVADTVNAADRCCVNVERAERELSSRDLALAALCLLRVDFLSARCPRRFFPANALRLLLSSRCFLSRFLPSFFRLVGRGTPTMARLLHRRHFCLLACTLRAFFLSSLRAPRFPRRRCPNFATADTVVVAGNDFALLGCIAASRCCWQACSISIDEFSHQSMP